MVMGPVSVSSGSSATMSSACFGSKVTVMVVTIPALILPGKSYSTVKKSLSGASSSSTLKVQNEKLTFVSEIFFLYRRPGSKSRNTILVGFGKNGSPLNSRPQTICFEVIWTRSRFSLRWRFSSVLSGTFLSAGSSSPAVPIVSSSSSGACGGSSTPARSSSSSFSSAPPAGEERGRRRATCLNLSSGAVRWSKRAFGSSWYFACIFFVTVLDPCPRSAPNFHVLTSVASEGKSGERPVGSRISRPSLV
mmetsp:Transcript_23385/g.76123  ORF Transcript_23385/g.76123 Transcript_23385/m.76123 type:complete len:249 (+) Transcript_23385:246-992(+)